MQHNLVLIYSASLALSFSQSLSLFKDSLSKNVNGKEKTE